MLLDLNERDQISKGNCGPELQTIAAFGFPAEELSAPVREASDLTQYRHFLLSSALGKHHNVTGIPDEGAGYAIEYEQIQIDLSRPEVEAEIGKILDIRVADARDRPEDFDLQVAKLKERLIAAYFRETPLADDDRHYQLIVLDSVRDYRIEDRFVRSLPRTEFEQLRDETAARQANGNDDVYLSDEWISGRTERERTEACDNCSLSTNVLSAGSHREQEHWHPGCVQHVDEGKWRGFLQVLDGVGLENKLTDFPLLHAILTPNEDSFELSPDRIGEFKEELARADMILDREQIAAMKIRAADGELLATLPFESDQYWGDERGGYGLGIPSPYGHIVLRRCELVAEGLSSDEIPESSRDSTIETIAPDVKYNLVQQQHTLVKEIRRLGDGFEAIGPRGEKTDLPLKHYRGRPNTPFQLDIRKRIDPDQVDRILYTTVPARESFGDLQALLERAAKISEECEVALKFH